MAEEEHPHLYPFLQKRLPELGLDLETYGPYVWGTVEDEDDEEELQGVVELLQASSESHGDDVDAFKQLKQDILQNIQKDQELKEQKHALEVESQKARLEQQLAQAKLEQQQNQKSPTQKPASKVDDAAKKALMQRFGYENDEAEEEGEGQVVNNRQVAAAANLERAKELRSKKVQTKKEEQQKTKAQKDSKVQLKDERRKRTTKGERKR